MAEFHLEKKICDLYDILFGNVNSFLSFSYELSQNCVVQMALYDLVTLHKAIMVLKRQNHFIKQ